MDGARERRDMQIEYKRSEEAKLLKKRVDEQKKREKDAKEKRAAVVNDMGAIYEKRNDAKEKVTNAARAHTSKMNAKDAVM